MFGCCNYPQQIFRKTYDAPPELTQIQVVYPDVTELVEREFEKPRPRQNWVMVRPTGETEVCPCPCHCAVGLGILC